MWVFLASDCMFFGSLISAYMISKNRSVVGPYPDDLINIPFTSVSSFVLLMSSLAMVLGLAAVQRSDRGRAMLWLGSTAFLGAVFLGFQVYEFTHFYHEGLTLQSNLFGSTFYMLTGFHGAHVFVGVIYLLTLVVLAGKGQLGPEKALNVEIAGLYWHFVDVVWIVIFPLVYLIP